MISKLFLIVAALAQSPESRLFPGGAVLQIRTDEMTDRSICTAFTPMRTVQFAVNPNGVGIWVTETLTLSRRSPSLLRIGKLPPVPLVAGEKPNQLLVPAGHRQAVIDALYSGVPILVRFEEWPSRDESTPAVESGDFAAAYQAGVELCSWPARRVAAKLLSSVPDVEKIDDDVTMTFPDWRLRITGFPSHSRCRISAIPSGSALIDQRTTSPSVLTNSMAFFYDSGHTLVGQIDAWRPGVTRPAFSSVVELAEKAGDLGSVNLGTDTKVSAFGLRQLLRLAAQECSIQ